MTDPVAIEIGDDYVATIELRRPPNNFFSLEMINGIADGLESLDDDPRCRAAVLCAQGKHFCAGADFSPEGAHYTTEDLYAAAVRIFRTHTPMVAAVHGAAVGGGLGLASGGRLPDRGAGGPLQRQLRPPRVPSRLRPERDPAPPGGPAGCRRPPVHGPARPGRGGGAASVWPTA